MRLGRRALLRAAAGAAALAGLGARTAARAQASGAPALLVGNTSYNPREESLPPAQKCLRDLEPRLRRFGFDVVTLHDPTIAQVQAELARLQKAVAANPHAPAVFYFVGHGFQSNAENFLVPAGGDLSTAPAQLAKHCVSLEKDVFTQLKRSGPAATVIMVDACRTPDRPRTPGEGYNQTMPPDGCHVAFATGPGKRAFAPNDPDRHTLFAEVLVSELETSPPDRSILLTLESVRAKVANRVNGIDAIVRAFGRNAQEPELASNVRGDPSWAPLASSAPAGSPVARPPEAKANDARPPDAKAPDPTAAARELEAVRGLASPEEAAARLKALLQGTAQGDDADIANLRLRDLEKVLSAARTARLELDIARLSAGKPANVAEDMTKALRGDKYAALRVAESLPRPSGTSELIERTEHGRWMIFASHLGNGIAAYRLSEHFRNVDRRDAEAARYLALARANQYTPPRQLDAGR
ncbi:MAG TPA: caspase family protein [Caldimonas sp.]|nr:caspase family protein [Caldimonas sp.]HEX2542405.1 caspase family protein [Caldimonas sp.]